MSFKQGQFYAIQARDGDGRTVFVETPEASHAEKLKVIARKAARQKNPLYDLDDYYHEPADKSIRTSPNPFALKIWPTSAKIQDVIASMRVVRQEGGGVIDTTTLKIVLVETSVTSYQPESPSEEETELRRFVLEKLSLEEQKLLKVEHWAVYNKLADRSMLSDEDEDN